jgi:hypothetical protein
MVRFARRRATRWAAANDSVRISSATGRRTQGNQAMLRSLQAKLAGSQPGDAAEQDNRSNLAAAKESVDLAS